MRTSEWQFLPSSYSQSTSQSTEDLLGPSTSLCHCFHLVPATHITCSVISLNSSLSSNPFSRRQPKWVCFVFFVFKSKNDPAIS